MNNRHESALPSVDRVLSGAMGKNLCEQYGHAAVVSATRSVLADYRGRAQGAAYKPPNMAEIGRDISEALNTVTKPALRRVFNLTGTVLHTNLGRALLSDAAIEHACNAMRDFSNVEFDIARGKRGDRDDLIEKLLVDLTGAEAATVVNNNAAAVLLVLTALARGREIVLSRSEMIEIGGSFRIPDVMRSAGVRLVEIGTTNRTHPVDYEKAITPKTAALMKVHKSNYAITGFTSEVSLLDIAAIARANNLPVVVDLGAGTLVDLSKYGLPRELIVSETVTAGADIVTFSGDKLLGGPQAGLIVGKKVLIDRIRRHPLKRALRVSKIILAALEATLLTYRTPDHLAKLLPTLRLLTRPLSEITALAERILPHVVDAVGPGWLATISQVSVQVGSGSLPLDSIPSVALTLQPLDKSGSKLNGLAERLRKLPIPIIGRINEKSMLLDLRCLEDEESFLAQIILLSLTPQ